ncbi:right-handed parallel beta-helix repeat-containing protein, partial [Microbacterium sp.]|uniref:right-handed parallel beta-helix repeat-containing protein n=1 Tax=Microbacterium sp. TaxID=51671 RepID=UPI00289E68F8
DNGRNGVTVNGGTLANGPSATGMPLGTYGNNEVSSATITGNTRYGVEVLSGTGVTVRDSTVTGGDMGIVVSGSAASISVIGNTITSAARQGIALRDGVTASTVSRNAVEGTEQGVYLRDAVAAVSRNDITSVTGHGVTVVGEASGSVVEQNRIAGRGLSAVDTSRTDGVSVVENDTTAWTATKPLDVLLRSFFQPLTIMWLALGAILLLTAVTGVRRRGHGIRDPYANLAPLSSFTKGVIAREEAAPPTRQAVNHS